MITLSGFHCTMLEKARPYKSWKIYGNCCIVFYYRPQTRSLSFAQLPSLSIGQNWAGIRSIDVDVVVVVAAAAVVVNGVVVVVTECYWIQITHWLIKVHAY